jgi:hypothetical protein
MQCSALHPIIIFSSYVQSAVKSRRSPFRPARSLSADAHACAILLCHLCILLLESLAEALRAFEEFVHAAHNAALFLALQALRAEIVYAVVEASLDQVGVHLSGEALVWSVVTRYYGGVVAYVHEVLHLLPLHSALQLALLGGVKPEVTLV